MKTAKSYADVRRMRYYPELRECLVCHGPLRASHPVWSKYVTLVTEVVQVTSIGYRCANVACSGGRVVYRSAAGETLSLRGFSFGLDVIAWIGELRWKQQRTRAEIHARLQEAGIAISEREVQQLYETYALLLEQSAAQRVEERRAQMQANGGMILSLDGIQPEKGNECLWVVREVLTGTTLAARNLVVSDTTAIQALLAPLGELGLPILGVISDGFKPIRLAVAALWPEVPHQLCQFHVLRDLAQPTVEADRHLKTALKKSLRGVGAVEQPHVEADTPESQVIMGYAHAIRAVLLEDGRPPLDLPGVTMYEELQAIADSLEQSQQKRGILPSTDC
jgi:hypothetical protein